jgi:catechol 2,3-dioxygenase
LQHYLFESSEHAVGNKGNNKPKSSVYRCMERKTIGTVFINVKDMGRQLEYYQQVIGLRLIERQNGFAYLGVDDGASLLVLIEKPDGKKYSHTTGLYHFAILVPSRYHLALVFNHLIQFQIPLQGASDHIVSEALYLGDPEGNGIEIYRDREKDTGKLQGRVQMDTLPLQVDDLLDELTGKPTEFHGLDNDTIIGHIHLHVGSLPEARRFYSGLLEMDEMLSFPSATFLAYNGYHHHIGANTWSGNTPPPGDALGLEKFTLHVASDKIETIRRNLEKGGVSIRETDSGYLVKDPSHNQVEILP